MGDENRTEDEIYQFDLADETPSERIVQAIAVVNDEPVTDCPPLYEVVDPDALDAMFEGKDDGTVTFRYANCIVTVRSNAEIFVEVTD